MRRLTVVIPAFNGQAFLKECLASTIGPDIDVVVVDNYSSDSTREIAELYRHQGVDLIPMEKNESFARACNIGTMYCRSEYVCFLNQDTKPGRGWHIPLILRLDGSPDLAATGPLLLYPNGMIQSSGMVVYRKPAHKDIGDGRLHYRNRWKNKPPAYKAAGCPCFAQALTGACMMVRRDLFVHRPFDESFVNGHEDVDWCFYWQSQGRSLWYEPLSVVTHHEGSGRRGTGERVKHEKQNAILCKTRWAGKIEPWFDTLEEAEA